MTITNEDCLGENRLPWWYDIERGVDKTVTSYYFERDDSVEGKYATLVKSKYEGKDVWLVEDAGFKSNDQHLQKIIDNYFTVKNEIEFEQLANTNDAEIRSEKEMEMEVDACKR